MPASWENIAVRGNLILEETKNKFLENERKIYKRNYFNLQKLHIKAKQNFRKRYQENVEEKVSCAFNQCYEVIYASCLRIQSEYIFLCDLNKDMSETFPT